MTWWCPTSKTKNYDAVLADGAVRSGKTLSMSLSFIFWAFYRFNGNQFAICGKTIQSARRNILHSLIPILESIGFKCKEIVSRNMLEITFANRTNFFYLFGGRDAASQSLIQGMTLGGIFFDEVVLMPRSFVEQALARCSLTGSTFWFNCNPESPYHWFYKEWIQNVSKKNCLYLHFTMDDNPSLSPDIRKRYETLYSGVFYERFVLGKWVAAQGLIYPFFQQLPKAKPPIQCQQYYISCDYGTVNPTSFGLWGLHYGTWYRIDEYYFDSKKAAYQKTDIEYYWDLEKLAGDRKIEAVIVDPSAASFMACIRREGKYNVMKAKNDVLNGIRLVASKLKSGDIVICEQCIDSIREFSLYRWENNQKQDMPRKEHDHAMDDIRYFAATVFEQPKDEFFAIAVRR